jgi:hypothetical protein
MAKKQTRRSISVSRVTYERLKAFCESNGISMSQFVETRVGDFLGEGEEGAAQTAAAMVASFQSGAMHTSHHAPEPRAERPMLSPVSSPRVGMPASAPRPVAPIASAPPAPPRIATPITSAAARFAIEPPPPIIKPRADQPAPPVAPRTADQIFTF